jgi:MoxR-like ATPase
VLAVPTCLQPRGSKPLPDFQRWAFALEHYMQYLADLHAVHVALEESIASAAAQLESADAAAAAGERQQQLRQALALFGPDLGLARAQALFEDMAAIDRQQQQPSSSGGNAAELPPTQHAAAYAAYLSSLARQCRAAEEPAEMEQVR